MSHPPPSLPRFFFFSFGEGQRADCAIVSLDEAQVEAYLADLDGTCSPLMSPWVDRGDWGQEWVAPQKGEQVGGAKKQLVGLQLRAAKSLLFQQQNRAITAPSTDHCPG